ncbi:hypothetical protein ACP275_11G109400 [Erythranthe tilingii]
MGDRNLKTISDILAEVSRTDDFSRKLRKLEFYVGAFEDELRKIDGFKRELPNCMRLLIDAIQRLKEEELMLFKSEGGNGRAKASNDSRERKNWMSSVQLWTTPVQYENNYFTRNQDSVLHLTSRCDQEGEGNGSKFRHKEGAFMPFKKPYDVAMVEEERGANPLRQPTAVPVHSLTVKGHFGPGRPKLHQQELEKKHRRCWSPELHDRFVDALNQLGGAQTATPKQIRGIMKVEGLTNDEVKSHLQKYRIHVRKVPTLSNPVAAHSAHSASPQGHLCLLPRPDEEGSATGGASLEEEEEGEKTEGCVSNGGAHKSGDRNA